jgi:4-hydroxy-3-polyprenylbenzoate decarboxylase
MGKGGQNRLIIGISGASGAMLGVRALDACRELGVESHLVVTKAAAMTLSDETNISLADLHARADVTHKLSDIGASIASGSYRTLGMIVAPCSVRTMSEIATGVTSTLLTRAADVVLKERRPLILMVRETPLHLGHLRTMTSLAEMGAIIAPPMPAFYTRPTTVEDRRPGRRPSFRSARPVLGAGAPVGRGCRPRSRLTQRPFCAIGRGPAEG